MLEAGVPLVQYSVVENSPHAYLPEEAQMIYRDFFSKFSRSADGKVHFDAE